MIRHYIHKVKTDNVMRELCLLLLVGGLYSFGIFLSNTFVNVFLWRQSADFQTIAVYNVSIVIFQTLAFIVAGRLAKKIDRIIIFRIGVIFLAFFFITVLLLGENAAFYNVLLGALLGIGYGFYWLAFNVLTFEITEPDTRNVYNGVIGALESISGMFAPLIAGFIIAKYVAYTGYMVVFSISLSFFLLAIMLSFLFTARRAKGKYNIGFVFHEIKRNDDWHSIIMANLFQGMREGIFMFVISILLFITTQNEFTLGMFNLTLCGLSFILYIFITKKLTEHNRNLILLIGCVLISASILIIVFKQTLLTFILYAFVIGIAHPMVNVPFNSLTYDVIGKGRYINDYRIEYIVCLEIFSNLGRLVSISLFIIGLWLFDFTGFVYVLLFIISPTYLLIYYYVNKIK